VIPVTKRTIKAWKKPKTTPTILASINNMAVHAVCRLHTIQLELSALRDDIEDIARRIKNGETWFRKNRAVVKRKGGGRR
jgi:hypothetical protein